LSVGIKGGVGLTDAYDDNSYAFTGGSVHGYSDTKDFIIGAFAELRLPLGIGAEADALYRPLHFTAVTSTLSGNATSDGYNSTWEFPILAKYRLPFPIVKPYVEAGPSFRSTTNNTKYLSNHGFSLGAGVEVKALIIRVSPEIRFTRWGSDAAATAGTAAPISSSPNQVEFLVGLSF
jgi:hypothetical protein